MESADPVQVLLVDDERDVADVTAALLEREDERFDVSIAADAEAGLSVLDERDVDCVVSDFDMPGTDGIGFLEAVRERYPDLPFVLFTGKGSEEVASEAFAAGATDYLQKERGREQYEVLANRIANAVEQRRARAAKAETEHRLAQLANQTNDVLWMFTADWEELLFVNDAYESVYGGSRETLRDDPRSFLETIHPDDRDRVREAMARLTAGEEVDLEYRVNEATDYGREVWVQASPITDESGEVTRVAGFSRDVTDRRDNQRELERMRDFLANTERLGNLGAWEYDADGDVFWTEGTRRIHGVDEDFDPTETAPRELVHPDDRDRVDRAVEAALDDAEAYDLEYRIVTLDEDVRWVRTRGKPVDAGGDTVTVRGYIQDVTEQRERELELEQYETIVETIPEGVFVIDEDGRIDAGNERAADMLGYEPEELLDTSFGLVVDSGVYDEEIVEIYLEEVRALLSDSTDRDHAQFTQTASVDGDERIYETHLALRPFEDEFRGTVGVVRDVTDRERDKRKLREHVERLEEFAAMVSHDLRNPLNVARGHLELAREDCASDRLGTVADAHERMEQLIEDLLTLAREGESPEDIEPLDLGEFVGRCWESVDTAEATLEVDVDGTIHADASRLRQLVENLFRNAVEHGGDAVTIAVGERTDGFYVADDGPGIPEDERGDVLEYGYSTADDGTGLGLSIVERVADAHGWELALRESDTGGARFDVTGVEFDRE